MSTLELYSIYERGFIMMMKDLKKFLETKGYTVALNNSQKINNTNYNMSFKTIFCHNYETDPFVFQEMPEEEDAFVHYFPTQCNSGFPIMKFELISDCSNIGKKTPKIDIQVSAYLLANNKTIKISFEQSPYDDSKYKITECELKNWKKHLCKLSEYIFEKIEK